MLKINSSDIFVGEIKQLLKEFNLPRCKVLGERTKLTKGMHYIGNNALYLCKEDNNINSLELQEVYNYGEPLYGITTNFKVTNNIYDEATHKYLGDYLRFQRDYKGLDLMGMYNCFYGSVAQNIDKDISTNIWEASPIQVTSSGTTVSKGDWCKVKVKSTDITGSLNFTTSDNDNFLDSNNNQFMSAASVGFKPTTINFSAIVKVDTNITPTFNQDTSYKNTIRFNSSEYIININGHDYSVRFGTSHNDYFYANIEIGSIDLQGGYSVGESIPTIYKSKTSTFSSNNTNYVVYTIPVKFGQKYTIGVESFSQIEVFCGLYKSGEFVKASSIEKGTYDTTNSCSFNRPFVYDKLYEYTQTSTEDFYESILTMFIKIPSSFKNSIVVLEGDYSKGSKVDFTHNQRIVGLPYCYRIEGTKELTWFGEEDYRYKNELLSYANCNYNALLSTRLVEYLTQNAINPISESYDIKKLQECLLVSSSLDYGRYVDGIWSEKDRKCTFRYVSEKGIVNNYFDVASYGDKEVEKSFGRIV